MALTEQLLLQSEYQPLSLLTGWTGVCQANTRLQRFSSAWFPLCAFKATAGALVRPLSRRRARALPLLPFCFLPPSGNFGLRGVRVH